MTTEMTFANLAQNILTIHNSASNFAKSSVNQSLTIRNWLIGYYIVEYEQFGSERASYGEALLQKLEKQVNVKGLNRLLFQNCRMFYLRYPQISAMASKILTTISQSVPFLSNVSRSSIQNTKNSKTSDIFLSLSETTSYEKCSTVSNLFVPQLVTDNNIKCNSENHKFTTSPELLVNKLSFSHIREIMPIEDPLERYFYEFECMRCGWSVRVLRRQISTNLFYRAGVSQNPEKLLAKTEKPQPGHPMTVKDPFVFEFLGLDAKETVSESDLEQALMNHLQEFLLELGNGFCYEARQKRIIIDDQYHFIDLVLYNRILHCNVIIELKNDEFSYQHFGQLNAYVAYYKENEMHEGDNPPVGILLCTKKGPKMVEYALSGMDNELFAATYMLQLPQKEQLEDFLQKQLAEMQS